MAASNQVFVSPGVFTREIDQSFLPTGITDIGAAIIGVTKKGPAFVPTKVTNFSEYREVFGGYDTNLFVPYAAASYLKYGSPLTVCRVLGLDSGTTSGYGTNLRNVLLIGAETADGSAGMDSGVGTTKSGSLILAELYQSEGASSITSAGTVSNGAGDKGFFAVSSYGSPLTASYLTKNGTGTTTGTLQEFSISHKNASSVMGTWACSLNPSSDNYIKKIFSTKPMEPTYDADGNTHWIHVGRVHPWAIKGVKTDAYGGKDPAHQLGGAFNTASLSSTAIAYQQQVGAPTTTYKIAASIDGTTAVSPETFTGKYVTPRTPTVFSQPFGATGSQFGTEHELFYFETLNDGTDANFDVKVEVRNPIARTLENDGTDYGKFDILIREWGDTDIEPVVLESFSGVDLDPNSDDYIGRRIGDSKEVFNSSTKKVEMQGEPYGDNAQISKHIRVIVPNPGVAPPASLPWGHYGYPTEYATASLRWGEGNRYIKPATAETWPVAASVNRPFLRKTIKQQNKDGVPDQRVCWGVEWENLKGVEDALRKLPSTNTVTLGSTTGYDNKVWGRNSGMSDTGTYTASLAPFSLKWVSGSSGQEVYTATGSGFSVSKPALMPVQYNDTAGNLDMSKVLTAPQGSPAASLESKNLKYTMAFYGGWDGLDPGYGAEAKYIPSSGVVKNVPFRFNQTDSTGDYIGGSNAFRKALDLMSNDEIFDFNLLFIPGVSHGSVTNYAVETCETRGDAFYVMDPKSTEDVAYGGGGADNTSIANCKTQAQGFNTNYGAVYYPWVKIQDPDTNAYLLVPPTCEIPGVMAFNDRVGHPWFAPAGFNRGALDNVVEAHDRLTKENRDELYNNKINPIGTFSGQGVVVFGQKTLQTKASALDRINVRRLLLFSRKLIASTSKFLVFEPNNVATRQKFVNLVNPILESIKRNQGIERFKVVCDESINTPDVIDRNILKGQIFIQPTRTAEFISIDFFITRTGASFDEV